MAGPANSPSLIIWSSVRSRPRKDHKHDKLEFQNSSVAGQVKTTSLAIWSSKTLPVAGPVQDHKPYDLDFQNFWQAGPAKTTNLTIWTSKIFGKQTQQRPQTLNSGLPKLPVAAQQRLITLQSGVPKESTGERLPCKILETKSDKNQAAIKTRQDSDR